MMRNDKLYLLPFTIGITLFLAMVCMNKTNASPAAFTNLPAGFEEFDEYRFFAHYDGSINGYDVKVMILPSHRTWRSSCRAILSLSIGNGSMKFVHDGWLDTLSYDMEDGSFIMPKDTVIRLSYKSPAISNTESFKLEEFSELPFFFYDIDFDGYDELILNLYAQGQKWINAYEVVDLDDADRLYSIHRKKPFTDLDDWSIIDPVNKTITNVLDVGSGEEWHTVYKITPRDYMLPSVTEVYTDEIHYWGIGLDTVPQYRRIYPHAVKDTTDWMPINQRIN